MADTKVQDQRVRTPDWVRFLRFLVVGVVNTAVGYGTILALQYGAGIGHLPANAAGYLVGATVSYLLNKHYTFESQRAHREAAPKFVMAVGICYLINVLVLEIAVRVLHWPGALAQAVAMVSYTLSFYFISRALVFRT